MTHRIDADELVTELVARLTNIADLDEAAQRMLRLTHLADVTARRERHRHHCPSVALDVPDLPRVWAGWQPRGACGWPDLDPLENAEL